MMSETRWQSERIIPSEGEYVLMRNGATDTVRLYRKGEWMPQEYPWWQYAGPYKLPPAPDPLAEKVEAVTRALPTECVFQGFGARIIHYVWKTPHGSFTEVFRAGYVTSTIPLSPEAARALADLAEALKEGT